MKFLKKIGKSVSKATKDVGKVAKKTYNKLEKTGAINPLGIGRGNLFTKRIRKIGKIGVGAGAGFVTGGIPGAIAGGGLVAYQQSKKGAGNKAFNWKSALTSAARGGIAGGLAGAGSGTGLFARAASHAPTAGVGGIITKAPVASKIASSGFGKLLATSAASELAKGAINPAPQYVPGEESGGGFNPMDAQLNNQNYIQNILDAYNKRKERYFYA